MKFSYSWLCEHLETDKNATEIGDALTNIGLELESLSDYSSYSKFVVATIKDFKKHPNADRLNICKVDDGADTYQVICGANNVKKGLKGIFAKEGMYIPGTQIHLKKGKIRGETSEGMLLSERELNLSDDHEGIIELSENFKNGTSAVEALKLDDPIFEIGITPNRGDCLSIRGVARDLSAKGMGKLKPLKYEKIKKLEFESPISWSIKNDDNSCEYVVSRYFKDVNNTKSPEWLQKKLISLGLRPINALVDITNFITVDLGRPLHVFDADKVGKKLDMRLANSNEKILALDNKDYTLDVSSTVIADSNNALAIAGIIGGDHSGCTENTKNVFLEVAIFNPNSVAKTGRSLGINSDARYRFERGLDKNMVLEGLEYASYLINKICGGSVSKNTDAGKLDTNEHKIKYGFNYFNQVIGLDLEPQTQVKILKDLKFQINERSDTECDVMVPSWRNDVKNNIDIVEEIIRIYGYDNINVSVPSSSKDEINNIDLVNMICEILDRVKKNPDIKDRKKEYKDNFIWEKLNEENSQQIWRLEQAKESINFRSIFDRQWHDIYEKRNTLTGVIKSKENNIIAGLIPSVCSQNNYSLELIRGLAWDERLNQSIPNRINNMKAGKSNCYIETTSEDNKLNDILHKSNWEISEERVLLGRSVWKRQNGYKLKSIETELLTNLVGNLQQQPELPSTIHIENNK